MLVIMGYGTHKRGTSMASLSLEVVGVVAGEQHSASGHGRSSDLPLTRDLPLG